MAKFKQLETGAIALIQQLEDGRIVQIGLTEQQSTMLQLFLSGISKESKLIRMPEEYDLVLKSTVNNNHSTHAAW